MQSHYSSMECDKMKSLATTKKGKIIIIIISILTFGLIHQNYFIA